MLTPCQLDGPVEMNNLFVQAIGKFLLGVIIIGLLLFLPAGSLQYWQGWLLMGILFVPMFVAGLGSMGIGRSILVLLPALCRSVAGEYLLVTDHRGAGESEGYRHRPLRHCPASDVYGHYSPLPDDAAGTCFALFFPYNAALHPADCQADKE